MHCEISQKEKDKHYTISLTSIFGTKNIVLIEIESSCQDLRGGRNVAKVVKGYKLPVVQ